MLTLFAHAGHDHTNPADQTTHQMSTETNTSPTIAGSQDFSSIIAAIVGGVLVAAIVVAIVVSKNKRSSSHEKSSDKKPEDYIKGRK